MRLWIRRRRSSAARCCATRSNACWLASPRAPRSSSSTAPCTTTQTSCAPSFRNASTPHPGQARSCSAAAPAAEQDLACPGCGVDAFLQLGAQLVWVVVQGAVDELDLGARGEASQHAFDLVAQHGAANVLGGGSNSPR